MPPTLREIARHAGVDPSTASRVLSGQAERFRIGSATATRVEEAARTLGFRPNLNARALRTQRSSVLGLLVADLANPFFAEIAGAVETAVAPAGYSVMVASSGESSERQAHYLDVFRARQVDGIIVAPAPGSAQDGALAALTADGPPLVQIDRVVPSLRAHAVVVDNRAGARALVDALVAAGRRRLAWVSATQDAWTMAERTAGFRAGIAAHGLRVPDAWVRFGGFDAAAGRAAGEALLAQVSPPDAIIAANNLLLQGVMEAAAALGRGPADVAFGAFDGLPLLGLVPYLVHVVEQPAAEMGRQAAARLLATIEGLPVEATRAVVPLRQFASRGA